jgi:hypothetical protein
VPACTGHVQLGDRDAAWIPTLIFTGEFDLAITSKRRSHDHAMAVLPMSDRRYRILPRCKNSWRG